MWEFEGGDAHNSHDNRFDTEAPFRDHPQCKGCASAGELLQAYGSVRAFWTRSQPLGAEVMPRFLTVATAVVVGFTSTGYFSAHAAKPTMEQMSDFTSCVSTAMLEEFSV